MYITDTFRKVRNQLASMRDGVYLGEAYHNLVEFQKGFLSLQDALDTIASAFGCAEPWREQWDEDTEWWAYYNVSSDGIALRLYGDRSKPGPDGEDVPSKQEAA
ncbi:MAG: hypothetical protein ABFD94_18870 [Armatimonadia bacterium]